MTVKVILSLLLVLGVVFPEQFSNFTEAWKLKRRNFTPRYLMIVRIACVVAIAAIWLWL